MRYSKIRTILLAGCAGVALSPAFALAQAQPQARAVYNIPAQDLGTALTQFGQQSEREIVFSADLTRNRHARAVSGEMSTGEALAMLLGDSGLTYRTSPSGSIIVEASDPQSGSAAGDGADGTVQALIVTAQKREENIQDVPIAMSAFTQEDLTRSQVTGGPDLMTQVPNMTFTKTNFTSYSIQIRGIGTQAISATTDAAVAVAFNNTPFIRNRFFEQEFYDLERVEVLRGPQGTLYGRNATAGVVNLLSAKPVHRFESKLSADVANYNSTRLEGMINIPLVEDVVALRLAGAWTKRDGFVTNQLTGNQIDGRDLWSTRLTLGFEPNERIRASLVWEHFEEDDDRLRSGKQMCKKDPGPSEIGGVPVVGSGGDTFSVLSYVSQGCLPASLYADESFQTPNGFALPFYGPTSNLGNPVFSGVDPYLSTTQSRDLRVIESMFEPSYRARSDVVQLQAAADLTPELTLASETSYSSDFLFSTQDYNRFNTKPGAFDPNFGYFPGNARPNLLDENGVFCDPQLGCSDRLLLGDLSTARSAQFSQEFRLSSDYDGAFNFGLGTNFLRYDTVDKYYVFVNSLTLFAAYQWGNAGPSFRNVPWVPGVSTNKECLQDGLREGDPRKIHSITSCIYIDPNPVDRLNDQGHNYFLSKNPFKLISYAAFGELYYQITPSLKLTAGARWTVDKKEAPIIPSWLLASDTIGYPVDSVVRQKWEEPTGRLTLDWKPELDFTDDTLVYASFAHGYKAGGANPPTPVLATYGDAGGQEAVNRFFAHPKTFDAEYINAFEVGSKNTLLDGAVTLNMAAFYYDYKGYQISQIIDRSAINLNFDAEVWGLEVEADWRPLENLKLGFKGGYESTQIADGEQAIDLMDRTAGDPGYVVIKPFPTIPSNCIVPVSFLAYGGDYLPIDSNLCLDAYYLGLDPQTRDPYAPFPVVTDESGNPDPDWVGYPGFLAADVPNNGEGIFKDVSGNELPNAPHFTATITADYTLPLPNEWLMALHTDLYYQSEAWTRIFNMEGYDKLKAYTNINFAAIFTNEDAGWNVMAYVKNVLDRDSITGAFLNSDDTGLTTNVFLTEPRLYGVRVTKRWTGDSTLGTFGQRRDQSRPYAFTLELGGQVQRHDAPSERFAPEALGGFPSDADPTALLERALDWGDGREGALIYSPSGSPWRVSLGARFGKTNGASEARREAPGDTGCLAAAFLCDLFPDNPYVSLVATNYGLTSTSVRESHVIVDFLVGRDVDLGLSSFKSEASFGLRYAELSSRSADWIYGVPDWDLPDEFVSSVSSQHHHYTGNLAANRRFEGIGPAIAWRGSMPLLGNDQGGHVVVEAGLTGAILFGKQKGLVREDIESAFFDTYFLRHASNETPATPPERTVMLRPISKSIVAPNLDLSLGLAYEVQGVKIGAGYRADRFFDTIDGGVAQPKDYDRTIHGPYFKVSVGFGG